MSDWDTYFNRIRSHGASKRETFLNREIHMLETKAGETLSHDEVIINGTPQNVSIIDTDIYNEKIIISNPGESFQHGGLLFWKNSYWLITDFDANDTIYTRGKMIRCNYLLKWVSSDCIIHEQWCVIEDGTKYLTGEYEDRNFIVTRGDTRIALTISKNEHTVKFNRETRFLIDDEDSDLKIAYLLTKPLKVGNTYGSEGVFKFVLQEVVTTKDDNQELGIADYYKFFPKNGDTTSDVSSEMSSETANQKKGWL